VGAGAVADFGHAPAIVSNPDLELVAVFDPDVDRARGLAAKFHASAVATEDALYDHGLDAVVIASPPEYHRANLVRAVDRRVAVLSEKPLADSEANAQAMADYARAAGLPLYTAFVYRYSRVAQQIRDWIREGIIGRVRSIRLVYLWELHGRYMQDAEGNWIENPRWRGRMLEGGPLVDCGVHQIDLARWWLGEEIVDGGGYGAWVADFEAPDHVFGHLTTESGVHVLAETSFTYGHTARDPAPVFTYEIIGDGGVIRYDRNGWRLEARSGDGIRVGQGASEKNFEGMYHAFARALATGDGREMASPEDGIIATRWATRITEEIIARQKCRILGTELTHAR